MSLAGVLLLLIFVGSVWTYVVAGAEEEGRKHLKQVSRELTVSIAAGFVAAQALLLASGANEHTASTAEYAWPLGIVVGVATYFYLFRQWILKYRAQKNSK